jgi:exonuclease SbcC
MQIVRVELENIKNYERGEFEFGPGLIAICGPNGAGKTTILEAIAWALFDNPPYKKLEDFIRRGAKRGSVNITFTSSADDRQYVVYRDTSGNHYAYDPNTGIKPAERNNQVVSWIKEQLRIDPATDLKTLFKSVIGTPQGTLTVSFSKGESERKKEFDKLLRVDEYSQASEKLKMTVDLAKSKIAQTREEMARIEEKVSRLGQLMIKYEDIKSEIPKLERNFELAKRRCNELREEIDKLEGLRRRIEKAESEEQTLSDKIKQLQQYISKLSEDFRQASEARRVVEKAAQGFDKYNEAKAQQEALLRKQNLRNDINDQLTREKEKLAWIEATHQELLEKLDRIKSQEEELDRLASSIREQEELERRANELRHKLGEISQIKGVADSTAKELEQLRAKIQELDRKIAQAEAARMKASELESLEEQRERAREEFIRLRLSIEQDRKFLSSIRGGLCPLLQEKCLNMKEGQTLDQYVKFQIDNHSEELEQLELQQRTLEERIKEAQEAREAFALLPELRKQRQEAEQDRAQKETLLSQLRDRLSNMDRLEEGLREVERRLKELDDPRGRASAIRDDIAKKGELLRRIEQWESQKREVIERKSKLESQLEELAGVGEELLRIQEQLKRYQRDYELYLEKSALAARLESVGEELDSNGRQLEELERRRDELASSLTRLKLQYDEARYESAKRDLEESSRQEGVLENELKRSKEEAQQLDRQIQELRESERELESLRARKDRLEQLDRLLEFVREVLKEAGPYIAEALVYSVSAEANQLYRDITGNQNVTLRWDYKCGYEILLEENGHERRFANLSGGEQVAAALSVKLALLKELSDLRIAFFDEPTANLDEQRRQRLAEEISRITDFDQLFIISHDDAFESFTYQVVRVPNRGDISLRGRQVGAD